MLFAALLLAGLTGGPAAVIHYTGDCDRRPPDAPMASWNRRQPSTTQHLPDGFSLAPDWKHPGHTRLGALAPAQFPSFRCSDGTAPHLIQEPRAQTADPWLAEDKLKHFFASFAITALAGGGARAAGVDHDQSLIVGVSFGTFSSFYKEVADARSGGFFSARDLIWDIAGVSLAFLLLRSSH